MGISDGACDHLYIWRRGPASAPLPSHQGTSSPAQFIMGRPVIRFSATAAAAYWRRRGFSSAGSGTETGPVPAGPSKYTSRTSPPGALTEKQGTSQEREGTETSLTSLEGRVRETAQLTSSERTVTEEQRVNKGTRAEVLRTSQGTVREVPVTSPGAYARDAGLASTHVYAEIWHARLGPIFRCVKVIKSHGIIISKG
jgi:hypothetical protein